MVGSGIVEIPGRNRSPGHPVDRYFRDIIAGVGDDGIGQGAAAGHAQMSFGRFNMATRIGTGVYIYVVGTGKNSSIRKLSRYCNMKGDLLVVFGLQSFEPKPQ